MSSIQYEKYTVRKMIELYCRKKHGSTKELLCAECEAINNYAQKKLDLCPFGDDKGACESCKIHCYQKEMRENIRQIMRYSGPRMLLYHPFDFFVHYLVDKGKQVQRKQKKGKSK